MPAMGKFEDYYETLQIHPSAEPEVIEAAYKKLAQKYHPDVNASPDASERMREINVAHDVLSDPERRKAYDLEWRQRKGSAPSGKPQPVTEPTSLEFKNLALGTVRRASFLVLNIGGPYSKISISNPDSWLRVIGWQSLSSSDELPLRVDIQVQVNDWSKTYSEKVYVRLDNVQTHLTVTLQSKFRLVLKDHNWHDIEFEYVSSWVKKQQPRLDSGEELVGKTFRYRFNTRRRKYQIRLRHRHDSAVFQSKD